MSQDAIQTVLKLFDLANKRDVEGLKAMALPECTFASPYPAHLPFSGHAIGPDACVELMLRMAEPFDVLGMDVKEVLAQGDTVVIFAEEKLRAKSTGKTTANAVATILKVRDGKFLSSRSFGDTYAVSELLRSNKAPAARTAPAKKSAAGAKKKNTLRAAKPAGKNTAKGAKKVKGAASGKKKTARARA